jgi:hypothetical protein
MDGCNLANIEREIEKEKASELERVRSRHAVREAGRQTDERLREVYRTRARAHTHTHTQRARAPQYGGRPYPEHAQGAFWLLLPFCDVPAYLQTQHTYTYAYVMYM